MINLRSSGVLIKKRSDLICLPPSTKPSGYNDSSEERGNLSDPKLPLNLCSLHTNDPKHTFELAVLTYLLDHDHT